MAALRSFYSSFWTEAASAPDGSFVAYHLGGAVFAIYDLDRLAGDSGGAFDGRGSFELAVNVDRHEDVDAALEEIAALGAHVEAAADASWGGRAGHFRDPEGNRWEVAWNPAVGFDDRGAVAAFE